jgi:hypothetical protein
LIYVDIFVETTYWSSNMACWNIHPAKFVDFTAFQTPSKFEFGNFPACHDTGRSILGDDYLGKKNMVVFWKIIFGNHQPFTRMVTHPG